MSLAIAASNASAWSFRHTTTRASKRLARAATSEAAARLRWLAPTYVVYAEAEALLRTGWSP